MSAPCRDGASSSESSNRISFERASRLLSSGGLARRRRHVESLVDRLCEEDAPQWIEDVLRSSVPLSATADLSVEQLIAVKTDSKLRYGRAERQEERLSAQLRYFLALALALARHGKVITSWQRDEVSNVLGDLAEVAPEPWRTVLGEASRAVRSAP